MSEEIKNNYEKGNFFRFEEHIEKLVNEVLGILRKIQIAILVVAVGSVVFLAGIFALLVYLVVR